MCTLIYMDGNNAKDIQNIITMGAEVLQDALDGIAALQPSKTTEMLGISDADRGLAVARKLDRTQKQLEVVVLQLAKILTRDEAISQRAMAQALKVPPATLNRRLANIIDIKHDDEISKIIHEKITKG